MKNLYLFATIIAILCVVSCNKKLEEEVLNSISPKQKCEIIKINTFTIARRLTTQGNDTILNDTNLTNQVNQYIYSNDTLRQINILDSAGLVDVSVFYFYNGQGKISRVEEKIKLTDTITSLSNFTYSNQNGKLENVTTYRITQKKTIGSTTYSKYKYNSKGVLVRMDQISDSSETYYQVFNFDEKGNCMSDTLFMTQRGSAVYVSAINVYEYDNLANIGTKVKNNIDPQSLSVLSTNNVTKITSYRANIKYAPNDTTLILSLDVKKSFETTFDYTINGNGNATKAIQYTYGSDIFNVPGEFPIVYKVDITSTIDFDLVCP